MVHRAAIQLDLAPTNVLISYIIGVGGYFSLPLSNAILILIETNITPLVQSYLGKVIWMKYIEKVLYNSKTHSSGLTDYLLHVS